MLPLKILRNFIFKTPCGLTLINFQFGELVWFCLKNTPSFRCTYFKLQPEGKSRENLGTLRGGKKHLSWSYHCNEVTVVICESECGSCSAVFLDACPTLSVGFSRQEYWSGSPFPSPGDLPDPGIEPTSPASQVYSLPSEPPGKPLVICILVFLGGWFISYFVLFGFICSRSYL